MATAGAVEVARVGAAVGASLPVVAAAAGMQGHRVAVVLPMLLAMALVLVLVKPVLVLVQPSAHMREVALVPALAQTWPLAQQLLHQAVVVAAAALRVR